MAKVTIKYKLNKIFPTVKVMWDNVTDDNDYDYIKPMVHALCGYYELYKDDRLENEVWIDFEFVDKWMNLCNSNGLTIAEVEKYYKEALEYFNEFDPEKPFSRGSNVCVYDYILKN